MYLIKRPSGYYSVRYLDPVTGKLSLKSTGKKLKSEATQFVIDFKKSYQVTKQLPPESLTVLFFNFLKSVESKYAAKTIRSFKITFRELLKFTGAINSTQLSKELFQEYQTHRLKVSVYTARLDFANLSIFCEHLKERGFITENFIKQIKKPRLPQRLPLFISEMQLNELLTISTNKDISDITAFAFYTGLRLNELINLSFTDIDFEKRILILNNQTTLTKSRKVRSVPLCNAAYQIANNRNPAAGDSGFLFTYEQRQFKGDHLSHAFKKLIRKAGLNDKIKFHSLRHSFASHLVQKGVPILTVSKLLGHASITTSLIYSHLSPESLQTEINKAFNN